MGFTINEQITLPNGIVWTNLIVSIEARYDSCKGMMNDEKGNPVYILRSVVKYYIDRAKKPVFEYNFAGQYSLEEINDTTLTPYAKIYNKIKTDNNYVQTTND